MKWFLIWLCVGGAIMGAGIFVAVFAGLMRMWFDLPLF